MEGSFMKPFRPTSAGKWTGGGGGEGMSPPAKFSLVIVLRVESGNAPRRQA